MCTCQVRDGRRWRKWAGIEGHLRCTGDNARLLWVHEHRGVQPKMMGCIPLGGLAKGLKTCVSSDNITVMTPSKVLTDLGNTHANLYRSYHKTTDVPVPSAPPCCCLAVPPLTS